MYAARIERSRRKGKEQQAIRQRSLSSPDLAFSKSCRPDCWQILSTRTYSYAAAARRVEGMPLYANQKAAEGWPQPLPEFRDRFADMNAPVVLAAAAITAATDDGWIINDQPKPPADPSMSGKWMRDDARHHCLALIAEISASGHVVREFRRPTNIFFPSDII